ncbi:MAG: DUF4827 domain-containing protein [Prevotella sp.]|nr:DUF4827 domain-containing protein [Prevotella sp.]
MKKFLYPVVLLLVAFTYVSCENYETYADKKEAERDAIDRFIAREGIQVIDDAQFKAQNNTTDVSKNQYVRFERNGVYMQIVRQGCGDKMEENKTVNVLCRFLEKNIMTDSILIRNDDVAWLTRNNITYNVSDYIDKMTCYRTGTTITASFVSGMMYMFHSSASVPAGWLVPLNYVNIGRPDPASATEEEVAKVRLIVPHSQGTADASSSVYPCYYEITYQRTR